MKLVISGVAKNFKQTVALKELNMELTTGIYGLLGPNGAGKTTFLRIMADILRPTSGLVSFNGMPIIDMGEQYRKLLGYMPQNLGIYHDFTAEQYLLYIAALKGLSEKNARQKIQQQLYNVRLEHYAKQKLKTYSGGMLRRIGIAQTLLNDPKILLLDEPTAGLDPQERIHLRNILSELSGQCIIVPSTHIVTDIELIAEKAILLHDGMLLGFDTVVELLQSIAGKVWCINLAQEEADRLPEYTIIGNVVSSGGNTTVRIFANHKPHVNAEPVTPTMEDLYIYYFQGGTNLAFAN